jgi:hypothetical protein
MLEGQRRKQGVTFDINKKMPFRGYQTAQTTHKLPNGQKEKAQPLD